MKVLFDTNVILDLLLARQPYEREAARLVAAVERSQLTGYLCATTITTLFYLYAKSSSSVQARKATGQLLTLFDVAPVNRGVLQLALEREFGDYEDAVLHEAARIAGVEAIVTRNSKDFRQASLRIYQPEELVVALEL